MSQETNLKSLGFTWKKQQIYWKSPQIFDPHISTIFHFVVDDVWKIVFVSVIVGEDDSPAPTLWSSLLSPFLPPPHSNSYWTDGCWFSPISPFVMFTKSINDFTIPFGIFSLFLIPFRRGMWWPPAVFTVLTNWVLGRFMSHV